jgi:hypothetical protein
MVYSNKINMKFLLFKKLSLLGLFRMKISGKNGFYNLHLSYAQKRICSLSLGTMFGCIKKLYPLINLFLLKESLFLFINIDKNNDGFLTKIFYSLVKKIRAYCIYDWGYGILTNYTRVYYEFFLEKKDKLLYKLPDIVFLLRILEKQHYIMTEVQNAGTLSLGLVDYENSLHMDYPIPSNTSLEYSYFFFRLLTKLIKNSTTMAEQDFYEEPKQKIKRLKFLANVLFRKFNSKKKFKINSYLYKNKI